MNQGALHFDALLSVNNFDAGIARIKSGIRDASGVAKREAESMDSAFRNLGTAIGGYFSAQTLFSFTKELINVRGEFQKTEIAFSTMLGSADKAKVLMGDMVNLAAKTPFSLSDVSKGAKQLLAFQVPAKNLIETLTRIGNISSGVSVPIDRIILAYGQVKAAGRLMGTEMRQFTEAGIPMYAELAKVLKTDETAIKGLIEAGKVSFKDVEQVIKNLTSEGGMFFELMEKQSTSMSGRVSNLGDQWDQMLNKIGQANEGILYDGIEGLTHLVEHYQELFEMIKTLVLSYGAYKAAIMVTSAAQSVANKTLATEIGYLSFSERMKLGRAIVTQRQTAATLAETQAEKASLSAKYATLQAEIAILATKKQKAVALGIERAQAVGNAQVQLALAQSELRSVQANGTAREVLIATKNVEKAQNTVIAAQESASIARTAALAAGTKFYAVQKELQVTATALSAAATDVETAAEAANVAAKTANAVATQRLTIAQLAQTVAMTAAARAASFLNATLFANPYALAAALIAALAYSIYKYNTALTVAEESQKRMNDDAANQIATLTEQEAKIKALIKVVEDQTSSEDTKAAAYKRIALLTNGRLDQLDAEAVKTGKATGMLQKYIEMLKLEAEAKRYVNELGRLETDTENLKNTRGDFGIGDMWDDFVDYDSEFTLNLKERKRQRVDRTVKAKEEEKKEIQKKLDDLAKRGVNITETEITEDKSPAKLGWAGKIKEEIKAIEATLDGLSKADFRKAQAKIKSLNELLNPKKEKQEGQIAEFLPLGSVKELQQRAQLIQEAMDVAINGQVKLRKLDKFGKDKDKKGNPFYTGEVISAEEAGKRLEAINDEINKKQYKSFQERIDESERQWNNYYKIAEFYGRETAFAQYKDLFQGAQSYLEYLEKQEDALRDLQNQGILTTQQKADLVFLAEKRKSLTGKETPFENFKREIDDALKSLPSLVDQLDLVDKSMDDVFNKELSNSPDYLQKTKYLEERKREILQNQKDLYTTFLIEQESFENKQTQIKDKYDDFRNKIGNGEFSDKERLKLLDATYKEENKAITEVSLNLFKKSKAWSMAFGNLKGITNNSLDFLIKKFEQFRDTYQDSLSTEEFKNITDVITNLRDEKEDGSFSSVIKNTKDYINSLHELKEAQSKYKTGSEELLKVEEKHQIITDKTSKSYDKLAGHLNKIFENFGSIAGNLGLNSEALEEFINGVGTITKSVSSIKNILDSAKGGKNLFSSLENISGIISAIIAIVVTAIKLIASLFNQDKKRERSIRNWKKSVDDLKISYQELNNEIEKTAGEGQLMMQRKLIANLQEQQRILQKMRSEESEKKKSDIGKISEYNQQISEINSQIEGIVDDFKNSITTTGFKELADKIADALIDGFGKGEDAAMSFEKVVNDVMKNAVVNALKIKFIQPVADDFVTELYKAMGYGGQSGATAQQATELQNYKDQIAEIDKQLPNANSIVAADLNSIKNYLIEKVKILQQQIGANAVSGAFDGLSEDEIKSLQNGLKDDPRLKSFIDIYKSINDVLDTSSAVSEGLKGDIKGITEKTAGALEAQFNAVRINIVAMLKIYQSNQAIFKNQLLVQSQIEINTRPLKAILKEITELNSKVKKNLAGFP